MKLENYKTFASWKQCYNKPRHCIKMQRYHFADKVHIFKAIVYSVFMYRCESWTKKKAGGRRFEVFKL